MSGIINKMPFMFIIKRLIILSSMYYMIITIFISCTNLSKDSTETKYNKDNFNQDQIGSESSDFNNNCKNVLHGDASLQIGNNFTYKSSELLVMLSDYTMHADTVLELTVDSDTAYLGRLYFSHPINRNKIYFMCWPIEDNQYIIYDADVVSPDLEFQHNIHINMTKIEFSSILSRFQIYQSSKSNIPDKSNICDTFIITSESEDSCKYFFRENKLTKITYYNPIIW